MSIEQSLFLRALRRESVPRTPVWVMRQAGRYLPEYRKVRQQAGDFLSLCKNADLACEVTLQPLRRFPLDAAILFSDILTIPDAMGLGLHFVEGEGPCFTNPLTTVNAIDTLAVPNIDDALAYVMNAVKTIRQNMPADLPLLGFSGSPWTLACYMIQGQSCPGFPKAQALLTEYPLSMHKLLDKLSLAVVDYLSGQVKAGANALMLFDTWGGLLSTANYLAFSLKPMQFIIEQLKARHPHIPIILFTKNSSPWLEQMAASGCDGLGLDWTCDLAEARALVGNRVALQGNLAPSILLESPLVIQQEVQRVLAEYGRGNGHIFNLGHGITPDVPPEHLAAMLEAVHQYSPQYHQDL